jgi:hypothetical protein
MMMARLIFLYLKAVHGNYANNCSTRRNVAQ